MNQENRVEALQTHYIQAYEEPDDISLVDFWITLLNFKKVFLLSFVFLMLVGAFAVSSLVSPRYSMSTILEIALYKEKPIESPVATIQRINSLILPPLTKSVAETKGWSDFKTDVSLLKDSRLIRITNTISKDDETLWRDFQSKVGLELTRVHSSIVSEKNRQLETRIKLEEALIEQTTAELDSIKGDLNDQQSTIFLKLKANLQDSKRHVIKLKSELSNNLSSIVSIGKLSPNPVSLSMTKAYASVITLSLFLSFVVTLVAIFRAKVIDRLKERL